MIYLFLSKVNTMLNRPYSQDLRPGNDIFSRRSTHTTLEVIWIEPMLMVLGSLRSKLCPKTIITWSWGPKCHLVCIDLSCALHIKVFSPCKTLHYGTRRASINMLEAIPTHNLIDNYPTLKKYRKQTLCKTW
jgi:hypothetical protein